MKTEQAVLEFNVYLGETSVQPLKNISEVKLPSLQAIKTEINPSGAAGKVNVALIGQFDALACTVNADLAAKEAIIAALQASIDIVVRAAVQVYDTGTGNTSIESRSYFMRGSQSNTDLGTVKKGETMGNALEFDCNYLKVFADGKDVLEIDKLNNIYRVNGEDMLAEVREAI